jgi:uncharacterized protein (DUF427 family)
MEARMAEQRGRVRVEAGRKRVRAIAAGEVVADTARPVLVWEIPFYPAYYFPAEDVRVPLVDTGRTERSPSRGDGRVLDVVLGERTLPGAARDFPDSPLEPLRGLVRLEWAAMDHWFEEDEPVYVHPRNPYTRVDILASSRHVRIEVDGETVAESRQPRILFETGLPPRYYLPLTDVRMEVLRPSDTRTQCPYKGTASYWSVEVDGTLHRDVLWSYPAPLPESQKVAGLVAFYDERVDVYLDGERQERPRTPFS